MIKPVTLIVISLFCAALTASAQTLIVYGDKADAVEINASRDLLADYQKASKEKITLVKYEKGLKVSGYNNVIYVGTGKSNPFIREAIVKSSDDMLQAPLEPETFVLKSIDAKTHLVIGADTRGTFYGVYDFSNKVLGSDPNAYWIGYQQPVQQKINVPRLSFRKPRPVYTYRGYFDNDNDLLANFKGRKLIVEFDLWKEIINTVARLGYNYIDIHDLLGRPEYYLRDYYIQLTTYHSDLKLIGQVIDYAHSKALLVQIPMYLGWEFKHITLDQTCLIKYYDLWMQTYEYYLTKTPIGKADLFLQRPRHPIYDWAYKCPDETSRGIRTGDLMNKMFEGLYQLLQKYRPGSVLFCDLWAEGRPLWESGEFAPRKEIQMLWADGGHANFKEFPRNLKGYGFGIYIHAGVWYNNVTQSPYPDKIKEAALMGIERNMTHNFLVNGQTFKDFLLNLTACALCAWDPVSFDPEAFYKEWTTKYFGANISAGVVNVLKLTYDANQPIGGFRNTMNESVKLLGNLEKKVYTPVPLPAIDSSLAPAEKAYLLAEQLLAKCEPSKELSFRDQVLFPSKIFYLDLKLLQSVLLFNNVLATDINNHELIRQKAGIMKNALVELRHALTEGSGWTKWEGFYKPENFRIHTPPPTVEQVDKLVNAFAQGTSETWLDDLTIKSFSGGIPSVAAKTNAGGGPIQIGGKKFDRGVGVNSLSTLSFYLDGKATSFTAWVGVDDQTAPNFHFNFFVIGDRKILFESHNRKSGDAPEKVDVSLTGIKRLGLLVTISEERATKTYVNWADAKLVMMSNQVPQVMPNDDEKYILTPAPVKTPKINSARVFGATPGNPVLYCIAATGERPMRFSAGNLPTGLSIDPQTGIISGTVTKKGEYRISIGAENELGTAHETVRIKIGDTIALTPPIGWNGWNSWAREIDAEKVKASANAMVNMGLKDHGWTYINIDDAWQGQRGGKYNAIQPNEKFPAFKNLVDYIHAKGLKLGVYSTPWITSYAGYTGASSNFENGMITDSIIEDKRNNRYIGKYRFEENDARQMAEWGVDYLKYDWRLEVPSARRMSDALKGSGRDIFYSLSNSAPFESAKDWAAIANAWRTGPDIRDSWLSLYISAFTLDKWAPYAGPGHWNDPDMMIVGNVTTGTALHPTRLTPDEQYSHVSLFTLLAAPLLIGCPIEQLDAFTLNLLTNDEIIAIDQDPAGKAGQLMVDENGVQIWVKPLEDGSYAVGLFNVDDFGKTPQSYFRWGDETPKPFTFDFVKTGLRGKYRLRDLWRQKELGSFDGSFTTSIPYHGVLMLRMFQNKTKIK